eukprot:TRINITY_DN91702_c0_g1_i1.p1 TRINITY_DN91702_c0_g1~~TRINITY_DN91702_c0_g1_i1.p1  ORF type:complete len:579 (+),score=93.27 TRINITY_DN91702_c0_g1_i1:129-1865(+)
MGALGHLNFLVVLGAQLPSKPLTKGDQLQGSLRQSLTQENSEATTHDQPARASSPRGSQTPQLRRRRPMAVPACDMMASFCVLNYGLYPVESTSSEGKCGCQGLKNCSELSWEKEVTPSAPSMFSAPTPSSSSSSVPGETKTLEGDSELQRMCKSAFPDMVMVPRGVVDLDTSYKERSREKVTKINLVLTLDNIAALAVIGTMNIFGAIYMWKICTRRSCSCRVCRNQYRTMSLIGSGGYGSVFLVQRMSDSKLFVSKKILVREITEVDEYSREAKDLVTLRHRHIVSYEDDFVHVEYGGLEPKTYFMIIMEYCPEGDLKEKIESDFFSFTEDWVRTIFAQLIQAVQYLHSKNVIHRDLKSQNVFLAHNGRVRLGDFGLCRHTQRAAAGNSTLTHAGTDCYMAPEMLSSSRYGKPADMWSLGCVLYELCTGQFMWELEGILGAMVMKDSHAVQKLVQVEIAPAVGNELKSILKRLLSTSPANRPTATACLRKRLFKRGYSLSRQTFGDSLGEPVSTPLSSPSEEFDGSDTEEAKVEQGSSDDEEDVDDEEPIQKGVCFESPHRGQRQKRRRQAKKGWR